MDNTTTTRRRDNLEGADYLNAQLAMLRRQFEQAWDGRFSVFPETPLGKLVARSGYIDLIDPEAMTVFKFTYDQYAQGHDSMVSWADKIRTGEVGKIA